MDSIVRQTVDGETETLENLLERVLKEYPEEDISWLQFLAFFSKRGRLHLMADITISPQKIKLGDQSAE